VADIFDEIAGAVDSGAIDSGGGLASVPDVFDEAASTVHHSETRAVMNDALRGAGGFLTLVDELSPVQLYPPRLKIPHAFGLGPKSDQEPFYDVFNKVTKQYGLQTEDKPQTEAGKLLGNVAENLVGAAPFGPLAAIGSGVLGGTGGYLGEKVSPAYGRAAGSVIASLTPAVISKLGVLKEAGEWLGPTITQFPGVRSIFGNSAIESAVGRTIADVSDNPGALAAKLSDIADTAGPAAQLDSLKTTAEVVGDSGLARAEEAFQNMLPNAPFGQIARDRAAARAGSVLTDYNPAMTGYDTSKAIEGAIGKSAGAIKEVEDAAWALLPKDAPIVTKGLELPFQSVLDDITYSGALPIEGEAKGLITKFTNATDQGVVSLGVVQDLRSKALEVARATAGGTTSADRVANKVATALEGHLRDIVDSNVNIGALPDDAAKAWQDARAVTAGKFETFAPPKPGMPNRGTKGLESVALKGMALDNETLLREGLSSPDKLAAHVQAAAAGGQDVRPLYQQALKAELDGAPQTRWADIIGGRRKQWETVFTPEEMANLDRNLTDIAAETAKNRLAFTTGSATNPRGNVQQILNRGKGAANLIAASKGAPTLLGAAAGAQYGWNKGETTSGSIGNALLYGLGGAITGRAINSTALAAGSKYDALLANALKDPRVARQVLEAAKPSQFMSKLGEVAAEAATVGAVNAGVSAIKGMFGKKGNASTPNDSIRSTFGDTAPMEDEKPKAKNIAAVEAEIDKDPYYSALYEIESGRNPLAANKTSSAKGGFQLINSTAKSLGVEDPFDLAQSFEGVKKLTEEHKKKFGDDPRMLYAAHYLGETTLRKAMEGKELTPEQQKQVEFLVSELIPRIERIYKLKQVKA
jgi:hypothetical protein